MKINYFSKSEFLDFAYNNTKELFSLIERPEAIIVKQMFPKDKILEIRNKAFENGLQEEPSWHPLLDDCPDYHRLHDNYPQAYVKQKFHGFYKHNWKNDNSILFEEFKEIFQLKNYLGGFENDSFLTNKPSDGVIPRINIHHYPKGGGYQSEHIDPSGDFAKIQTLILASQFGEDYQTGGLYARTELNSSKNYFDPHGEIGDMVVISPAIPHGVDYIDNEEEYSWKTNDGRWLILPLFLYSDYEHKDNIKPKQLS